MKRFILAIDPGTTQSAFVYWDNQQKVIVDKGILPNLEMIQCIYRLCKRFPVSNTDAIVIEMVASYGMPVGKEVFETCVWIGRFWQASRFPVHLLYRRDVKIHLCGNMKAKDGNIRQALIDMLGPQGTKKNPGPTYGVKSDEWAALGVAVTFAQTQQAEHDAKIAEDCRI